MVDGLPRREVVRQQPPGAAAADDVEHGVQDFAGGVHPGTPGSSREGHEWFEEGPLGVGEVALWYAFLMLGILPSECLRTPFQTVS